MKRLLLSLAATLILSTPASAFAYTYTFTCGPSWSSLPVAYWINSAGSADVSFSALESAVEAGFGAWGDPCCSNYSADYQGTTQLTATNNQGRVVLSWTESQWNPNWGSVNQTIGITFSQVYNNCTIAEAPILFNGVGFTFSTDGSATDLQTIATHEIGHSLGLGHSPVQSATMYAAYIGGTSGRSLHQDDVDGVCSLYNRSCTCFSNSDCAAGEQCVNQRCEEIPCQSDTDCEAGLECNQATGDCEIPPCNSDADCSAGFICGNNNICVSGCPACRKDCTSNADCGSSGYCVDGPEGKLCLVLCGQNSECPGDSTCYAVDDQQGGTAYVCGAPDATSSLCPSDYLCESDDISHECDDNSDCDAGQTCQNTTMGRRCLTEPDPCDGVDCPGGETCQDGACVDSGNNNTGNNNTGNNNTGNNNTGNNTGNNETGNNTSNSDPGDDDTEGTDDPIIIVFPEEEGDDEGSSKGGGTDQTCATVSPDGSLPGALLLLIGLFGFARRRR